MRAPETPRDSMIAEFVSNRLLGEEIFSIYSCGWRTESCPEVSRHRILEYQIWFLRRIRLLVRFLGPAKIVIAPRTHWECVKESSHNCRARFCRSKKDSSGEKLRFESWRHARQVVSLSIEKSHESKSNPFGDSPRSGRDSAPLGAHRG